MPHVIIIGNSAAGLSAACALARVTQGLTMSVISAESHFPYKRSLLIDFILGRASEKELFLHDEAYYDAHNFNLQKAAEVTRVDTKRKRVVLENNTKLSYDYLIIASGGKAFPPDIPGKSKEGVFLLNTLDDALAIKERLAILPLVCLVGQPDLCARFAEGLAGTDKEIKIIGIQKQQGYAASEKIEWLENVSPAELIGETAQLQALKLSNGKIIGTSAVIFMGARLPASGFLKESGIGVDNGFVMVDDAMRTNLEDVFACGSVAKHQSGQMQDKGWDACCVQGERAAQEIISLFERGYVPCQQKS